MADDTIVAALGADSIIGAAAADTQLGAAGADSVQAVTGVDTVQSAVGADIVQAGAGADTVQGAAGGAAGNVVDNPLRPKPPVVVGPAGPATDLGKLSDLTDPKRQGTALDENLAKTDSTRHFIASVLTFAVIAVSVIFALVTAWIMIVLASTPSQNGKGGVYDLEKVMPFVTLVMGQTLYPLATIAIGWYFAARQNETNAGK